MSDFVPVFVRSPNNYDMKAASDESGLFCPEPTKTQQQFAEDADINVIVRRFGLTGELPDDYRAPQSGDFTGVTDYHSALNAVREADAAFMEVPAEIRARFDNDPAKLIKFVENAKNREEAIELGLVPKPVEKPRDVVAAVDELKAAIVNKPSQ